MYTFNITSWYLNCIWLMFPFLSTCLVSVSVSELYTWGVVWKILCYTQMYFSFISMASQPHRKKNPKAVCVYVCVFQIHSRVPPLALFPRPAEWSRRCPLPHCKEEPQAEVHFLIKTPSREELQRGWQLLGPVPLQDSLGTHLDHDVYLVFEILSSPSCVAAASFESLRENVAHPADYT